MANIDPQKLAASLRRLGSAPQDDVNTVIDEAVNACVALFRVSG